MMIENMAAGVGVSPDYIINVASSASHAYYEFEITKSDGKKRKIHHPSRQLKALQKWLLRHVIEKLPIHDAAAGYIKRKTIFDNASHHADSRFLLRMDFADFFPSITENDIILYITRTPAAFPGWSRDDVEIFCRLVCRNSRLTIGAPTSPAISNAICLDMDSSLSDLAAKHGIAYTRYADDLFFSTNTRDVLGHFQISIEELVANLTLPANLTINTRKTRHSSKRGARRVTGIVLGSDGKPHIGRALKRRIRGMIHQLDLLDPAERDRLAGLIAYAMGFDRRFLNRLITKYGHASVMRARRPGT
jgi:RNA-directed DNA polymerase